MTKVAVLGCGPAGLLAAHAAVRNGASVVIYSDKAQPSQIGGAQFLHRAIPEITNDYPDAMCDFRHMGKRENYAKRVYGDPLADVSWGSYHEGMHPVWNMRQAYGQLWARYAELIVIEEINPDTITKISQAEDVVLSCIPAPALCGHIPKCNFVKQDVWIQPVDNHFENLECAIVYNGSLVGDWYRWSSLFGHTSFEYPHPKPMSTRISKPLRTDCPGPVHLGNIVRLGRYGAFEKRQLIHHAYEGAEDALQ